MSEPTQPKKSTLDNFDFIDAALKDFREAADAESEQRHEALDDIEFWSGEQWSPMLREQRALDGRPCLQINRLSDFVAKVVNEQRSQKPGIQIDPVGSNSDPETAQILEGLIRHIQERSDADAVYEDGYQTAVVSGVGYWRVKTEYVDDETFNQEIKIEPIKNRFSVFYDPRFIPGFRPARYCFIVEDMPKSEFKEAYPDADIASLDMLAAAGNAPPGWLGEDNVRVAEYWHVEETRKTIKSPDGQRERVAVQRKVVCSHINAVEKLEEYESLGTIIPIVPTIINDIDVNGKRRTWGLVRHAKDPQRQYNLGRSAITEAIALAPKAPFIGYRGQFESDPKWKTANTRTWPYLEVDSVTIGNQPAPLPQRNIAETPIQAMSQELAQSDNDLKSVTGLYDASLGQVGPEQSGQAIVARQNQGGISTLTYSAALARAIKMTGRIILELIPHIYDAPRVEHIVNPDGTGSHAALFNSQVYGMESQEALAQIQEEDQAVKRIYDVGVGRYNVTVSVGPSYQSKRQEAAAGMLTLINSYPQIVPIAGDILARNLDWPGAEELAERMQKMLPQQLQPINGDPQAVIGQLQQQLQQLAQQNQTLQQHLAQATSIIETRQVEAASRERIAQLESNTALMAAELKSKTTLSQAQTAADIAAFKAIHGSAHDVGMSAHEHAHENVIKFVPPTGGDNNSPGQNPPTQ